LLTTPLPDPAACETLCVKPNHYGSGGYDNAPRRWLVRLKQIVRKFDQVFWQSMQWKTTCPQLDAICFNLCCRDSKVRILDSSSGFRDSSANGVSIGRLFQTRLVERLGLGKIGGHDVNMLSEGTSLRAQISGN
jgi:hypothetical protein